MAISYHGLSNTAYKTERWDDILLLEGYLPAVYYDTSVNGGTKLTIGVGFNLDVADIRIEVMRAMGLNVLNPNQAEQGYVNHN